MLIAFLLFYSIVLIAQQDFFVLKKGSKTVASYMTGYYIAFQTSSKEWSTGIISKIQNDSFSIRPMVITYSMFGADTTYYPVQDFGLKDVVILPKKGVRFHYINGQFSINGSAGHIHWYWIKSGWIFRVGSAGYLLLHLINELLDNSFAFSWSTFGIAAGIFLVGEILKHTYKLTLPMGKKYHLQFIKMSN